MQKILSFFFNLYIILMFNIGIQDKNIYPDNDEKYQLKKKILEFRFIKKRIMKRHIAIKFLDNFINYY